MWYSAVGFVVTLTLSLLVAPLTAEAQQATNVHRIGRLSAGSPTEPNPDLEAFRQGLRELGYVEGQNLIIESRYAEGSEERLPDLAAELVRLKETVPQSARVAVLANPAAGGYESVMHNLTGAAQALGLQLRVVELRRAEELDTAFATMTREGVDALIVVSDPALMDGLRGRTVDLAA